eukprot:11913256-Prorocentrum_lima.AAC.1
MLDIIRATAQLDAIVTEVQVNTAAVGPFQPGWNAQAPTTSVEPSPTGKAPPPVLGEPLPTGKASPPVLGETN